MNRVFNLQINKSKFEEAYNEFQKKVNKSHLLGDVVNAIKIQLAEDGRLSYGMNFSVKEYLGKPLTEKGYSKIGSAVKFLKDKGYFIDSTNLGNIEFTPAGWAWINGEVDGGENSSNASNNNYNYFNYFDIPPSSSKKIRVLLQEINRLPINAVKEFSNLLLHQLRTILALALIEYWEKVNSKKIPTKKRGSLRELIQYTIDNAKKEKLHQASKVVQDLNNLKASKTKDIADDIVHCSYTLANEQVAGEFCNSIKHLLSLIFGR